MRYFPVGAQKNAVVMSLKPISHYLVLVLLETDRKRRSRNVQGRKNARQTSAFAEGEETFAEGTKAADGAAGAEAMFRALDARSGK